MSVAAENPTIALPPRLLASLAAGLLFTLFLTFDQMHWWRLKPDYAFGWLVPLFTVYVVYERRDLLRQLQIGATGPGLTRAVRRVADAVAAAVFGGGLLVFLVGAAYRAGAGVSQPGSLALALGFSGVLLGLAYFGSAREAEQSRVGSAEGGLRATALALATDRRIATAGLFLFPAFIWILSAPLVTAVENAISLFLLNKVITVVFFVFNLVGLPLVQQGNVLLLPMGQVGVADACSGIRSLTACLFAGSFLAAMFLDRFWKKALLVGLAMLFAFVMNLARSLFLAGWAYAYGSDAIEGALHDGTGYAVLGLTSAGLFALLPLFNGARWRRWFGVEEEPAEDGGR